MKLKIDFQESPLMFLLAACTTVTVFIYGYWNNKLEEAAKVVFVLHY